MKYVVAVSNEYIDYGSIVIHFLRDEQVIKLIRRFYRFPEEITTVAALCDYYENYGSFIKLDGDTQITVAIPSTSTTIFSI